MPGGTIFIIPVSSTIEAMTKMLVLSRTPGLGAISMIGLKPWGKYQNCTFYRIYTA